jgi:hypothetical protein
MSEFPGDADYHLHAGDDPREFFDRWLKHVVNEGRPTGQRAGRRYSSDEADLRDPVTRGS